MAKESELKQITKRDWISGNKKPSQDYENVLATDGREIFTAYIRTANYPDKYRKRTSGPQRIWNRRDSSGSGHEANVKHYLTKESLLKILPGKT